LPPMNPLDPVSTTRTGPPSVVAGLGQEYGPALEPVAPRSAGDETALEARRGSRICHCRGHAKRETSDVSHLAVMLLTLSGAEIGVIVGVIAVVFLAIVFTSSALRVVTE